MGERPLFSLAEIHEALSGVPGFLPDRQFYAKLGRQLEATGAGQAYVPISRLKALEEAAGEVIEELEREAASLSSRNRRTSELRMLLLKAAQLLRDRFLSSGEEAGS